MQNKGERTLSRRSFIQAGMSGISALCLGRISFVPRQAEAGTPVKGFINPKPSPWFLSLAGSDIMCRLCPKQCRIAPGKRGKCGVRENRNGKGYTLAWGNPVLVQIDPVERKPFFHVRPGIRALSVSTTGCPLECRFCEVWDMALTTPEEVYAYDLSPQAIVSQAKSAGVQALSYAFGEPVAFYEYMTDIAGLAKTAGMLNLMHTSGYISPEPLKAIAGNIDAVNIDLKGFDPAFYRDMVGGDLEHVKTTLKILKEKRIHIEITYLIIPTLNDDIKVIQQMCYWIKEELGADVPIHFSRFYPLYKLANLPPTPVAALDKARDTAMKAGLKYVYVSRVTGHIGENTFCSQCRTKIISRMGFIVEAKAFHNGKCETCGTPIEGIWA